MSSSRLPPPPMSKPSRGAFAPKPPQGAIPDALRAELAALYPRSQSSPPLFASPLGPFFAHGRAAYLARFVFFGPHASDDFWRLALLAGFDHRDLRASRALLALASRLADDTAAGPAAYPP